MIFKFMLCLGAVLLLAIGYEVILKALSLIASIPWFWVIVVAIVLFSVVFHKDEDEKED